MNTRTARRPAINTSLDDNERWKEFEAQLRDRGVRIRWAWQAKSAPDARFFNVHCVLFYGQGDFQPSVASALVIDYCAGRPKGDQHGFALYLDRGDGTIQADVDMICTPRKA